MAYDYIFDEQTTLYIAYAKTKNDDNVDFSVNSKGHGDKLVPLVGDEPHTISLGFIYTFNHQII